MKFFKHLYSHFFKQKSEIDTLKEMGLIIGENCSIYSPYCFDSIYPWLIEVGKHVIISTDVKILAHDASTGFVNNYTRVGIVKIGNDVFIGQGTTILPNVRIGDNVIIGARSIVTKDLKSNGVYAGCPAKYICSIETFKERHCLNLESYPRFEKPWYEWATASTEEKLAMKSTLQSGFGYVK